MTELERIKIAVKALISLGIAKNQEEIGRLMGYTNKSSFSQVLNGKVPLPNDFINKLCKLDSRLVKMWIVNEVGNVLRSKSKSKQVYSKSIGSVIKKGIPLIPLDAMAGFGEGEMQVMPYDTDNYTVPEFEELNVEFMIRVKGSSMYPKYNSGDIVACKKLPLDTFFQWNKVYVLDTIQGAMIKRVCKSKEDDSILCVSDNAKYEPFNLHRSEIHSLAIVLGVIRLE
ncbi:S24 family peptidase [Tenacibaculum maritimum]|nr:S24 family peptidase [Tenacibaculum maritimum]MDB0610413.1 S24 family peptidase [Tenacibaculum maritimum]